MSVQSLITSYYIKQIVDDSIYMQSDNLLKFGIYLLWKLTRLLSVFWVSMWTIYNIIIIYIRESVDYVGMVQIHTSHNTLCGNVYFELNNIVIMIMHA